MKKASCVAIVAKHEEKYIQECICYNYILGWDAIILVIHRDPTDNRPDRTEELINELPKQILDKVTIIQFEYVPESHTARNHQSIAYQELIYPLVKDKFEWMAMFDVDEYLYDSEKRKVNEILDSIPSEIGQVILTSISFGHNNQILSAPLTETRLRWFNKRGDRTNHKSIVRIDSIDTTQKWYDCNSAKVVDESLNLDNPCLIHYESGAMEDWVNRQYKWGNRSVENKLDYDYFIGHFTTGTKDNRMLIYVNELDALLRQCFPYIMEAMPEMVHPSQMAADTEANIYSQNQEIEMLPSEYYGKEVYFLKDKLLSLALENNSYMKIPKIIHQVSFDAAGPAKHLIAISETWKEKHPDWEYRFWDRKTVEEFIASDFQDLIPLFHSFPFDIRRWNYIRYLILYRFGGLYVDMDYECIEPLDSLLWNTSCCLGMEPAKHAIRNNKSYIIGNALMASVPNHDFFARIVKYISTNNQQKQNHEGVQAMESTLLFMLNRMYDFCENKEDVTLLPAELVAPLSLEEVQNLMAGMEAKEIEDKLGKAYAIHYFLD